MSDAPLSSTAERAALKSVLDSPEFAQSDRMRGMLRFLVETTLQGKSAELKETVIGVSVFRRELGYDPKADGVVRSEARRLRSKLQEYYLGSGNRDELRIDLPKGGYVPHFLPASVTDAIVTEPPPSPVKPRRSTRWFAALAAAALLTLGVAISNRGPRPIGKVPRLLTDRTAMSRAPRLSPDGKRVAYSRDENGFSHIFIQSIDGGIAEALTSGAVRDYEPAWSPDGKRIAALRREPDRFDLRIIDLRKRSEQVLSSVKEQYAIDWSPDGNWIATSDRQSETSPRVIVLLSVENAGRRVLTKPLLGTLGDRFPRFSPDGRYIAFQREVGLDQSNLFLLDVNRPDSERQVADGGVAMSGHCWSADGRNLIASIRRRQLPWSLYRIAVDSGASERIAEAGIDPSSPDSSRTGDRIVYVHQFIDSNIWERILSQERPDAPVAASGVVDTSPDVSPDGEKVVFRSTRTGSNEIWLWDRRKKLTNALTHFDGPVTGSPRWSPDGRQIAFDSRLNRNADIYRISADGGSPVRLTETASTDVVPKWSRDGRYLYFASDRSGQWQVWRMQASGGDARQVTWNGGFAAAESPDGKWLYFSKRTDRGGLWRQPLAGGAEELVTADLLPSLWGQWTLDDTGRNVYHVYAKLSGGPGEIRRFDLATRTSEVIRVLSKMPVYWDSTLALVPGGKSMFYTQLDYAGSDIYILE